MHLIFAIILLSIILVARASSSGSKAASDRRVKEKRESRQQWIFWNRLNPRAEGFDVKSYLENPQNKYAILTEVKDCYDSIFSKKPLKEICPTNTWSNPNLHESIAEEVIRLNKERAACILCAKRGYAYNIEFDFPIIELPREIDKEVMKWCRDELVRQNKDVRLVITYWYFDRKRRILDLGKWKWAPKIGSQYDFRYFADVVEDVK